MSSSTAPKLCDAWLPAEVLLPLFNEDLGYTVGITGQLHHGVVSTFKEVERQFTRISGDHNGTARFC